MTIEKNARVSVLRTGMEPDDGSRQGVYLAGSLRLGGGRWLACWRRAFLALCPDELSSTAERELDAAACGPEAARVAQRGSGQAGQLLDIRASGAGEATLDWAAVVKAWHGKRSRSLEKLPPGPPGSARFVIRARKQVTDRAILTIPRDLIGSSHPP